ncbi:MAG TPA: sulfate ABC transporter permease subunit [Actinomycetota bacterium]|nr:sulfate ABC transporter permease subunit [Actinomycetota bacterium]
MSVVLGPPRLVDVTPGGEEMRRRGRRRALVRGAIVAVCLLYLTVVLLGPLVGIFLSAFREGLPKIGETLTSPDVRHAFFLTFEIAIVTLLVTTTFGAVTAWVLVRHRFVGRRILNALVELPLAMSPVTVGLACVLLFGRGGWFEPWFTARGIQVIFALPSMILVTIFICIPFVIRSVAPVLEELGTEEEDAARTLGASTLQTLFRVILPNIRWGLFYGIALTTARSIGEIGAVLIVSGMLKGQTETATIYVLTAFEERMDAEGYIVALTLAAISIVMLLVIEISKRRKIKEVMG